MKIGSTVPRCNRRRVQITTTTTPTTSRSRVKVTPTPMPTPLLMGSSWPSHPVNTKSRITEPSLLQFLALHYKILIINKEQMLLQPQSINYNTFTNRGPTLPSCLENELCLMFTEFTATLNSVDFSTKSFRLIKEFCKLFYFFCLSISQPQKNTRRIHRKFLNTLFMVMAIKWRHLKHKKCRFN